MNEGLSIEHLSPEAIAALVDGELSRKAEHRAKVHLVHCRHCRDEVTQQREASQRVRSTECDVSASGTLIERLKAIPAACSEQTDIPESQKHYGIAADGCRRPETLGDAVDLLIRKITRKDSDSTLLR